MFTFSVMPVKFTCLVVLFLLTTAWEVRQLARPGANHVSHGFHLLMSLLMLAMVPRSLWMPLHRAVSLPVMIAVMALGAVWFLGEALRHRSHRAHALGCAGMFVAMVWHLGAMQLHMSHPMPSMPSTEHSGHTMDHGMNHSMEHGPMMPMPMDDWMTVASRPGGVLWWLAVVGLVLMAGLLWMAVRDLRLALRHRDGRWGHAASFCMNFGMFWMSTGLMTPVLPFFRYLSF